MHLLFDIYIRKGIGIDANIAYKSKDAKIVHLQVNSASIK